MVQYTAFDPVEHWASVSPERLAARDLAGGREWTYGGLDQEIQRVAHALTSQGIEFGDRVATIRRNSVSLIVLQYALLRLGAIFVPLNWRLSAPEIALVLQDCSPKLLCVEEEAILPEMPPGCQVTSLADFPRPAETGTAPPSRTKPSLGDTCVLLYTSGTSGTAKGVRLTARNLWATAANFSCLGEVDEAAVFLCDSPMFHVIGLVVQIWAPFRQGGRVAVARSFDAERTNARLADAALGVTHYFCVPQMADALARAANFAPARWTGLKALFTGGAPNPPARVRWWLERGVRMVDGYGMTETGTLTGMPLGRDGIRAKAGSVGQPGPLTSIRVVDMHGADVGEGAPGEILARGPNVTPGYWRPPPNGAELFTADGWLRTGDIGRRDSDGFVFLVDRRSDVYISGGENVYPAEVEAVLLKHPAVQQAAVVGVPHARWGEAGRAFIVTRPGHPVDGEALLSHCRAGMAGFKVPKDFVFRDALPQSGSGKVLRRMLRDA